MRCANMHVQENACLFVCIDFCRFAIDLVQVYPFFHTKPVHITVQILLRFNYIRTAKM